jgi:hypothetical protein
MSAPGTPESEGECSIAAKACNLYGSPPTATAVDLSTMSYACRASIQKYLSPPSYHISK